MKYLIALFLAVNITVANTQSTARIQLHPMKFTAAAISVAKSTH